MTRNVATFPAISDARHYRAKLDFWVGVAYTRKRFAKFFFIPDAKDRITLLAFAMYRPDMPVISQILR
jgi:hypothetical protein